VDAITGGSDDGWWVGPSAEPLNATAASRYTDEHGVELLADNPDDPNTEHGPASVAG
jgi:hypothetical protein